MINFLYNIKKLSVLPVRFYSRALVLDSKKVLHDVSYCRPSVAEDSGTCCVAMILPECDRNYFASNYASIKKGIGLSDTMWTIDLCFLLKRFQVPHVFHTRTVGINPDYKTNRFFQDALNSRQFEGEELRVMTMYEEAKTEGINILQDKISLDSLLIHIKSSPAIILVNNKLLACDVCGKNKIANKNKVSIQHQFIPFEGLYVILCGYDMTRKIVYYRNPDIKEHICMTSFANLEDSRLSFGTDVDTILVFREQQTSISFDSSLSMTSSPSTSSPRISLNNSNAKPLIALPAPIDSIDEAK